MRSLKRYEGKSGGVCSVASPDSCGTTCQHRTECVDRENQACIRNWRPLRMLQAHWQCTHMLAVCLLGAME